MKLLFVIPKDDDDDKYLVRIRSIDTFLPLGIAQLAAVLEKHGHVVDVLDLRLNKNRKTWKKALKEKIRSFSPQIACINSYFMSLKSMDKTCSFIKQQFNIPVCLGGAYPALFPYKLLSNSVPVDFLKNNKDIDFLITGEGEVVLPKLLENLEKEKQVGNLPGLSWRKGKKLHKSKKKPVVKNLDNLPLPSWSNFNLDDYPALPKHHKKMPVIPMSGSRGCSWSGCSFCCQPGRNIKGFYRRRSPISVVDEMLFLESTYGAKEIRFWDDNFTADQAWVREICRLLKEKRSRLIWSCHARADYMEEKTLEQMKKAGCWQIMYGIESGSENIIKSINKGISLEKAGRIISMTKKAGIETRASYIIGLPGEYPELTEKTIRFARKNKADITQFSIFTPYPGTKAYERIKKSKKLDKDISRYNEYNIVYLPEGYRNKKHLEKAYKKAYKQSYLNAGYIVGLIKKIRTYGDIKRYYEGLKTLIGLNFKKRR